MLDIVSDIVTAVSEFLEEALNLVVGSIQGE